MHSLFHLLIVNLVLFESFNLFGKVLLLFINFIPELTELLFWGRFPPFFFFNPHLRTFFHCCLERKGERETSIGCLLYVPRPEIKPTTQVCTLTRIQTHNLLVQDDAPTKWAVPARAGFSCIEFLHDCQLEFHHLNYSFPRFWDWCLETCHFFLC